MSDRDSEELGTQLLIELEETKRKMKVIRGVIDDVLVAAEKGIKNIQRKD